MKNKRAISLIVLVITIIVIAILAATIIITLSNTNIISQTSDAVFKSDLQSYKEMYEMYVTDQTAKNSGYNRATINAVYGDELYTKIFGDVPEKHRNSLKVSNGSLVYKTEGSAEKEIAKSLGYKEHGETPESYFINCTIQATDKSAERPELTKIGQPCFDSATGTLYSVALPDGETELVIPTTIGGVKVNAVSGEAWGSSYETVTYMPETIKDLYLPSGVTMKAGAFAGYVDDDANLINVYSDGYINIEADGKWVNTNSKIKIAQGSSFSYDGLECTPNFELEGTIKFPMTITIPWEAFKVAENTYDISMCEFTEYSAYLMRCT